MTTRDAVADARWSIDGGLEEKRTTAKCLRRHFEVT
jgi:hypothetical protein